MTPILAALGLILLCSPYLLDEVFHFDIVQTINAYPPCRLIMAIWDWIWEWTVYLSCAPLYWVSDDLGETCHVIHGGVSFGDKHA